MCVGGAITTVQLAHIACTHTHVPQVNSVVNFAPGAPNDALRGSMYEITFRYRFRTQALGVNLY